MRNGALNSGTPGVSVRLRDREGGRESWRAVGMGEQVLLLAQTLQLLPSFPQNS